MHQYEKESDAKTAETHANSKWCVINFIWTQSDMQIDACAKNLTDEDVRLKEMKTENWTIRKQVQRDAKWRNTMLRNAKWGEETYH